MLRESRLLVQRPQSDGGQRPELTVSCWLPAHGALRLTVAPFADTFPTEQVAARRRSRLFARVQAQHATWAMF